MTTGILTLFTTYLIFPIIGLIMIGVDRFPAYNWSKFGFRLFDNHGEKEWYKLIPALAEYPNKVLRSSINMTISKKNCGKNGGWKKIITALRTETP